MQNPEWCKEIRSCSGDSEVKIMDKAGIPCQDPPLELQVQYAVNMGIGEILVKNGFLICICGGIARLIFQLAWRKGQKK